MKAIRIHTYGGLEVLRYEEAPRPEPGPDEVLVRVHAAAINPIDWKVRAGYLKNFLLYSLPLIPGWDFSGVIEYAGRDAGRWKPGDEVYGRPEISRNGAYAEYIVVRESEVALKPASVDHVHVAAIPLAGLTAWQALFDTAGLSAGQKALIHAAAGGVGHYAVQFAKWKGAHVIGTASGRNHGFLRELGVDEPIDYTTTRFEDAVAGVDVVLDSMGGDTRDRSWKVLKKGGILVGILNPPSPEAAEAHGVRHAVILCKANPAQLTEIATLVDSGRVKVHVEAVFPLAQAGKAHQLSETGHARGKIVLRVI